VLALTLLALDYVLVAPNVYGTFFFGKITIVLYWLLQIAFLSGPRIAYRYFRYTRTLRHAKAGDSMPILVVGRTADADVLLRAIESGAVRKIRPVGILSPSLADRGQAIRGISVLGGPDDIEAVVGELSKGGTDVTRLVLTPTALAPDAKPETILMRARRLGLVTSRLPSLDDGGEALRLAPVNVEDLLLRPKVRIDYRRLEAFVRRWRVDRRRNLRPHRNLRRGACSGDRELGACPARRAGDARRQTVAGEDRGPSCRRA
jgi:O-antigen biosynthesis protein WbqV